MTNKQERVAAIKAVEMSVCEEGIQKQQCGEKADVGEHEESAADSLSRLCKLLEEPIPENPTAKYIADAAQNLVDNLNAKRKTDQQLLEDFRQSLEAMNVKILEKLQQQLYQTYDAQSSVVDQKLQDLFACLDNIASTEQDLQNFRMSLSSLYQEIHTDTQKLK